MKTQNIKINLTILLICILNLQLFSQGSIVGANFNLINMKTNDDISLASSTMRSVNLSYDFAPYRYFSVGVELHKSIDKELNMFEGRFKLGVIINNKHRLQFPVYPFLGMYSLKQTDQPKLGSILYGIHGGIRFYVTDRLAVQGMYTITRYGVTTMDGERVGEPFPMISGEGFTAGLVLYLPD